MFNDDINVHAEPLITIVDQFSLNYIKKEATDLYRFFDLIPFMSVSTISLSLRALYIMASRLSFKMRDQSKFNILEQLYQRLSDCLLKLLEVPDTQFDLISY